MVEHETTDDEECQELCIGGVEVLNNFIPSRFGMGMLSHVVQCFGPSSAPCRWGPRDAWPFSSEWWGGWVSAQAHSLSVSWILLDKDQQRGVNGEFDFLRRPLPLTALSYSQYLVVGRVEINWCWWGLGKSKSWINYSIWNSSFSSDWTPNLINFYLKGALVVGL